MLSRDDLYKELGKNLFIVPFKKENFRENSINLTASEYAWTIDPVKSVRCSTKDKIILKPNKTTLILTEEVLGFSKKIGGTVHSKVGLCVLGISHIGTMFGPSYCGRFAIPIHNETNYDIEIKIGDTFASLVFFYMHSKTIKTNDTDPGHSKKYAEWHLDIKKDESNLISPEWCKDLEKIKEQFNSSEKKKTDYKKIKKFTKKKILLIVLMGILFPLVVFGLGHLICFIISLIDKENILKKSTLVQSENTLIF